MKPDTNYLGQFLKALREQRGFENTHEYVKHYKLPVSYVYYTEIESGKKYLGLERAKQLCEALEADLFLFYSQLLKDILPAETQNDFLALLPLSKHSDPQEIAQKEIILREAYQRRLVSQLNFTANMANSKTDTAQRLTAETLQTIDDVDPNSPPNPNSSNTFYGVVGLSKQKQEHLARLIADLCAEFDSYDQHASEESQLLGIAFSPIAGSA